MSKDLKKFDSSKAFKVKHLSPEGIKVVEIAFPSEEDWIERESRRRMIVDLQPPNKRRREDPDESESELVERLCPELQDAEPYEAGRILDLLSFAATKETIVESNKITVILEVLQATTTHVFRMPTSKEQIKFDQGYANSKAFDKTHIVTVTDLRIARKLYDDMKESVEGYVDGMIVPIIHQSEAVAAAFIALKENLSQEVDP